MKTSIVADAVAVAVSPAFVLSSAMSEQIALAAEMASDATFDFSKACDSVASAFKELKDSGVLNYASYTVVADKFKAVATVRARDNGAVDPEGAGADVWDRVAKRNREIHGISKPKAENADAKRVADKREADKAKALE